MARSIFESFQQGFEGGQALARQRRADNASRTASSLYQSGDYRGAESAFLNEGMINEAGAIGDMGERNRQRQGRESVRAAMTGEGTPLERIQRGQTAAMESGDFDLASQLQGMSSEQLNQTRENARLQAGVMMSLTELPEDPAARRQAALRIVQSQPGLGYTPEQIQQLPDEMFSNQSLTQAATGLMDIEAQVTHRYNRERDVVEDDRAERFHRDEISMRREDRDAPPRLSTYQRRQIMDDFTNLESTEGMLANFRRLVEHASPADLAGVGPGGAALESAHSQLALALKGPAMLDLGALVGSDFRVLANVIGEPGNLRQLAQSGGRDGILARLEQIESQTGQARARMQRNYGDYREQLPDTMFRDLAAPPPPADDNAPPRAQQDTAARQPPPAAISRLQANPTPQEQTMFDEVFGEGAAARVLGRRSNTAGAQRNADRSFRPQLGGFGRE